MEHMCLKVRRCAACAWQNSQPVNSELRQGLPEQLLDVQSSNLQGLQALATLDAMAAIGVGCVAHKGHKGQIWGLGRSKSTALEQLWEAQAEAVHLRSSSQISPACAFTVEIEADLLTARNVIYRDHIPACLLTLLGFEEHAP